MTDTIWGALGRTSHRIRMVDIGGVHTRILEAGTGPDVLVLAPGTGGHLEAYARNIAELASDLRVVAYDPPGHGYSSLADSDIEIADYERHLLSLLDALGIEAAHLSGESLGGWVAAKFAAHHPDRVGRLVLNTPGGTMLDPAVMERIRSLTQEAVDDPSVERVRARLEWLMADPASVTDELIAVRRAIYARPGFSVSVRHVLCLQDATIRRRNLLTDAEIAAITAPTMVVWTSDDPSGPAAAGQALAEALPDGRFEFINGAGHWPQWEQPDRFNQLVREFTAA